MMSVHIQFHFEEIIYLTIYNLTYYLTHVCITDKNDDDDCMGVT